MAITESKKQSDLERRLKLLRQQVYGKMERSESPKPQHIKTSIQRPGENLVSSDITFLYQDLSKIGILATIAVGIQIVLFLLIRNHILNINFF